MSSLEHVLNYLRMKGCDGALLPGRLMIPRWEEASIPSQSLFHLFLMLYSKFVADYHSCDQGRGSLSGCVSGSQENMPRSRFSAKSSDSFSLNFTM